jgi:hypothetical protein
MLSRQRCHEWSRRTFLQAGALAGLGLNLPALFAAKQIGRVAPGGGQAKSCILLFGTGGPSQHDTFDPKPESDSSVRGEFEPIETSVPGMRFAEHLSLLAQQAHHLAVLRSVYHKSGTHGVGVHYNMTGHPPTPRAEGEPQVSRMDPPCVGSVIRQLRGDKNGLPATVQLPVRIGDQNNFQWGGQHGGFLGAKYDPLMLIEEHWNPGTLPPAFLPHPEIGMERMSSRSELLRQLEQSQGSDTTEAVVNYRLAQERAFSVLKSRTAWEAFLLEAERPETLARYGDNKFGRSCLVARRLVEAGVGLVTVPWMFLHSTQNFDTHADHFNVMKKVLLPPLDQAFSALVADLAERGLLDETLVVWTGEFGRTPKINKGAGRDHWGNVYSTVLAGGGVRGGQVYGSSDKSGGEPAERPVHTSDFFATIYHALGYGSGTIVHDAGGRPHSIVPGTPVTSLF